VKLPPGARPIEAVTSEMTAWAVEVLHDRSLVLGDVAGPRWFGGVAVVAQVEVHTNPTAENLTVHPHRGVGLYRVPDATPVPDTEPSPAWVKGVDVSAFQPVIDWPRVAGAGYVHAWIKATEGYTWTSPRYAEQWTGAGGAGLLRGAYHFFRTSSGPELQVRRFVDLVRDHGEPEMGYTLDVEWQRASDPLGGLDPEGFAEAVLRAVGALQNASGRRPVLYSAPGFWALLPAALRREIASATDLWIAAYRPTPPAPLDGWTAWRFWQRSSKEDVPGIGPVDVNVWAGTLGELGASTWADVPSHLWQVAADVDAGVEGLAAFERVNPRGNV
jgi:GH25 family lysozyme M1 (1,4-beta-N-acetylmuramidase)